MSTRLNETVAKYSHLRRGVTKGRLLVGIVTVAAGLLFTSVALANDSTSTSAGSRSPHISTSSPWTTPLNELNAPSIPTPGGAAQGIGSFDAVMCPTASLCVAVGADVNSSGIAATTSNGGSTWTSSITPSGLPELKSVSCSSAGQCVAVGSGVAISSVDGGATWSAHSITNSNTELLGVSCASDTQTCVAVGVVPNDGGPLNGVIVTSSDSGATWTVPSTKFPLGALGGVSCTSGNFCVAVGAQILATSDGGQTWTQEFVNGGTGVLRSVSCGSATTCVAVGANPMGTTHSGEPGFEIQSTNGGDSWSSVNLPAGSWSVNALSCPDTGDCVLSGPSGNQAQGAPAWTSSDGGSTWTSTALPSAVTAVSSVSCITASSCVFVGVSGTNPISGTSASDSGWSSNLVGAIFSSSVANPS